MHLKRQAEESYEQYFEKICQAIRDYPVDIAFMTVIVDLYVFVRASEFPDRPIRGWIGSFNDAKFEMSLDISNKLEDRQPFIYFAIDNTLFSPYSRFMREDNQELYSLNQPFLKRALQVWKKNLNLGEISEVEGLPGIYKYGFLPEEEWDKS
jgi:hypothetical protein